MHFKNHKTLSKEIKDLNEKIHNTLKDLKTQCCQDVTYSEIDLQIKHNPNPNCNKLFININKPILKHIWKGKENAITKTLLEKNEIGRLPGFKTYKATVIKNGYICQWTKWRAQKMDLHRYIQLVFDKDTKAIPWRKASQYNYCFGIIQPPYIRWNLNV